MTISRPPLRILYVHPIGHTGGAGNSLLRLLESLDRRIVEPHVAAPDGGAFAADVAELGLPLHPLPLCHPRSARTPLGFVRTACAFHRLCRDLRRVCRAVRPSLVHANSLISAWAAVRVAGAPVIWHVRDLQSPPEVMRLVRPKAVRVIAISETVAANVQQQAPQGAPIVTIYNGFNHRDVHVTRRRSQVREDWEMAPGTPLVGCMAQLVPWKRHDLLLRAMPGVIREVPQVRLIMMGDAPLGQHGRYVQSLHDLAAELDIAERVVWTGFVDHPADALAALDVLAHPTDREPFGRVVLEALALGIPVVAINQAGPAEIIEDGRSGLLVPPDDPEALVAAIVRLLQDEDLRQEISDGARIRAGRFAASTMAARVVELYHEVLAGSQTGVAE